MMWVCALTCVGLRVRPIVLTVLSISIHFHDETMLSSATTWHTQTHARSFIHALWKWDRALKVDANNCGQHNRLGVSESMVRTECKGRGREIEVFLPLSLWFFPLFCSTLLLCVRSPAEQKSAMIQQHALPHSHTNTALILYRHGSVQFNSFCFIRFCRNVKLSAHAL